MIVYDGEIRGIRYWICKNVLEGAKGDGYWVVYVDVSGILKGNGSPIEGAGDVDDLLSVHEDCTFFDKAERLPGRNVPDDIPGHAVVAGWDYMHGYDLAYPSDMANLSSRQTLEEVKEDVRAAIESLAESR